MNQRGADALIQAGLRGDKQVEGAFVRDGGACAVGTMMLALGFGGMFGIADLDDAVYALASEYEIDLLKPVTCPECHQSVGSELCRIAHMNDKHHWDFITIARKLGPQ